MFPNHQNIKLEKELQLSRHEVETLIEAINSTMEESKKIERDLISIQVKIIEIPTVQLQK